MREREKSYSEDNKHAIHHSYYYFHCLFSGRSPLWYVPGLTEALDLINQYNPKDDTIELITCK